MMECSTMPALQRAEGAGQESSSNREASEEEEGLTSEWLWWLARECSSKPLLPEVPFSSSLLMKEQTPPPPPPKKKKKKKKNSLGLGASGTRGPLLNAAMSLEASGEGVMIPSWSETSHSVLSLLLHLQEDSSFHSCGHAPGQAGVRRSSRHCMQGRGWPRRGGDFCRTHGCSTLAGSDNGLPWRCDFVREDVRDVLLPLREGRGTAGWGSSGVNTSRSGWDTCTHTPCSCHTWMIIQGCKE